MARFHVRLSRLNSPNEILQGGYCRGLSASEARSEKRAEGSFSVWESLAITFFSLLAPRFSLLHQKLPLPSHEVRSGHLRFAGYFFQDAAGGEHTGVKREVFRQCVAPRF